MKDAKTENIATPNRQTDALSKWEAESGAAPTALEEIRLDQNERLLVPFTTSVEEIGLHYLDYPSMPGYVRCIGEGCLLCRIKRKKDQRDLWPVYDVIAQTVGVLAVAPNMRPQALRPQLISVMRRLKADERFLLAIAKIDRYRFGVTSLPLNENADDGAEKIAHFVSQFEAASIDLAGIYPQLSNEELAAIPEVATVLQVRGFQA